MDWISVKDRLPEDDKTLHFHKASHVKFTSVLACGYSYHNSEKPYVKEVNRIFVEPTGVDFIDDMAAELNAWHWSESFERITHWMPLPEPPKGE